jgi:hypothetical protein
VKTGGAWASLGKGKKTGQPKGIVKKLFIQKDFKQVRIVVIKRLTQQAPKISNNIYI